MIIVQGWYRKRPGKQIREASQSSIGISRLASTRIMSREDGLGPMQVVISFTCGDENLRISIHPEQAREIANDLLSQAREAQSINDEDRMLASMTNPKGYELEI